MLLFYLFMFIFFIVLLLLLCHVCYCDACKCLRGLGICVWFYSNKLMMMMMMKIPTFAAVDLPRTSLGKRRAFPRLSGYIRRKKKKDVEEWEKRQCERSSLRPWISPLLSHESGCRERNHSRKEYPTVAANGPRDAFICVSNRASGWRHTLRWR